MASMVDTMDRAEVKRIVASANRSALSRRTGISLSGVSRILSGKRNASTRTLIAIASELSLSMEVLYLYLASLRGGRQSRRRSSSAA